MTRWDPDDEQVLPRVGPWGATRFMLRLLPVAFVTFGGLGVLLVTRLIEAPVFGARRPITPFITQGVCKTNMVLLGIRSVVQGRPMPHKGSIVANHASWLDIFALNALDRIYFVAKHEVAGWPGIGWLARATGTVFVERRQSAAKVQKDMLMDRLEKGHRLLFFPEGTSTDGRRVLDFKPTLFAAFFDEAHRDDLWVQPMTVIYTAPKPYEERFFGWWGSAEFAPHFAAVLAAPAGGKVEVVFHDPLRVADFPDRKSLAQKSCDIVRSEMNRLQERAET